ncbi:hypothetical protein [Francisella salimarina]|uniref:hypothetical protein n=1 Tax=Francisella salimarina TaxID=2599927 RepID=UPI003D81C03D
MIESIEISNYGKVDLFYISQYKEFDLIELERYYIHLKWFLGALNTSYNKDFAANYLFAQLFIEALGRIQTLDFNVLQNNNSKITKNQIMVSIFFEIFDKSIENAKKFIVWLEQNKDRFPITDVPNLDIIFEPIELEKTCYINYQTDSENLDEITILKVFLSYSQGEYSKSIEFNFFKNKYRQVFDFFNIDISKLIKVNQKANIKHHNIKRIKLNKDRYTNITFKNLTQVRDALFTRYQVSSCLEECYLEYTKIIEGINIGLLNQKDISKSIYYSQISDRLTFLVDFFDELTNKEVCPLEIRFGYYMHKVSEIQRPIGNDRNYEKERIRKGNPISINHFYNYSDINSYGIKTKIKPSDYSQKIDLLSLEKSKKEKFREFYSDEGELELNKSKLLSNFNSYWIYQDHLFILDSWLTSLTTSVGLGPLVELLYDDVGIDKKIDDAGIKRSIKERNKRFYIDWLSVVDDIHNRSYE